MLRITNLTIVRNFDATPKQFNVVGISSVTQLGTQPASVVRQLVNLEQEFSTVSRRRTTSTLTYQLEGSKDINGNNLLKIHRNLLK
jgi:hypothetical protein